MLLELGAMKIGWRLEGTVEVYALANTNFVEICEVETGNTAFEEGVT